jgi:hypothetical protein
VREMRKVVFERAKSVAWSPPMAFYSVRIVASEAASKNHAAPHWLDSLQKKKQPHLIGISPGSACNASSCSQALTVKGKTWRSEPQSDERE